MQSKFEVTQDQREGELIPSIVTTKHLDSDFSRQNLWLIKCKPGVFNDGQMQKNDAPFLKAFLNPSEA